MTSVIGNNQGLDLLGFTNIIKVSQIPPCFSDIANLPNDYQRLASLDTHTQKKREIKIFIPQA